MTREEAKYWLEIELKTWEDECKSKHPIKEALNVAIKALEQEPILDKIRAEIEQEYRDESEHHYGQGLRRALDIIDKYKAETENT